MEARLPYVTDGDGMHTFTDPVDGERYVSAYVGVDITQRVFACFDQVDLKAPITLRVVADPAWTVLSNGHVASKNGQSTQADAWEFTPTPPIPIDLFVLCAGPWHSRTLEHAGLPMGWHARRSLAAELDRDFDELRRMTEQCFDHYADLFDEPFPFDSYDQVFVPELNWGAMECPGCVTFRDEFIPRGRVTEDERRSRAMVIAHEMSHMWFGDLVSQTWWEDIWLNESFAEYMGFRVSEDAAGFAGTRVGFEVTHKPGAMVADRRRSTHPVAPLPEDVPDVDTASTNFDAISYAQGRVRVTPAGDLDGRRGLPGRCERTPDAAPVRQRHPCGPDRRAGRRLAARGPGVGRGVAAAVGARHHPGRARRRRAGADPRRRPAAPVPRHGVHDGLAELDRGSSTSTTSQCGCRTGPAGSSCPTRTARPSPGCSSTIAPGPRSRTASARSRTT